LQDLQNLTASKERESTKAPWNAPQFGHIAWSLKVKTSPHFVHWDSIHMSLV
jgi:hypothetical protein